MNDGFKVFIVRLLPIYLLLTAILIFHILEVNFFPHPLALLISGFFLLIIRKKRMNPYTLLSHLKKNFLSVLPAIEILLLVGMLIAAWSYSGVLGLMVQIGFKCLDASYFLPGICVIASIASLVSGSSWTTAGTFGLALMGVGEILGFPKEIAAGAIISGCYFGDKLSPLSDTTNLASNLTSVPIFEHIRHMLKTTIISFVLALIAFSIINIFLISPKSNEIESPLIKYISSFTSDYFLLIPVLLVFGSAFFKIHVRISLLLGILSSGLLANGIFINWSPFLKSLIFGFVSQTGETAIDLFLSGGGMIAVLPTELLILTAVWYGGILEASGYLGEILQSIGLLVKKQSDVILAAMGSAFLLNLTTADQYLSIVIPARAFRELAQNNGIKNKDISRALEDSGTISSPLIPWNSCGAFMTTSLGVPTFSYLPYVFFNLIHISLSVLLIRFKKK